MPSDQRLLRVFPRKTKATPTDALAYYGPPDLFAAGDAVHISVTFTADKPKAEILAEDWRHVAPVSIGGVAYGDPGKEFIPRRYIKEGYTFTSRGCPRRCWFCSVWKRDPVPRLLPIQDGWNILDDNLLACPESHVRAVFAMLQQQGRPVAFTGGLEALALQDYQVDLLAALRPRPNCFFAYDPGDDFETVRFAAERLIAAGFSAASHRLRCYCLIGYPKRHDGRCRAASTGAARRGIYAYGDALATGNAQRTEVDTRARVAAFPALLGTSGKYSSPAANFVGSIPMPSDLTVHNELFGPIEYNGKTYYSSQYFHRQYVNQQQGKPRHRRYDHFMHAIRAIPLYAEYVTLGHILEIRWESIQADKPSFSVKFKSIFKTIAYHTLTLLDATAQAELSHHLDDEGSKQLAHAANKRQASSPALDAEDQDLLVATTLIAAIASTRKEVRALAAATQRLAEKTEQNTLALARIAEQEPRMTVEEYVVSHRLRAKMPELLWQAYGTHLG